MKNSGGKKLIAILIILFLGWLYTADDSYSTSPSYSNPPKYTNKTEETETINTYHVEKCGQGKCEFKGTCYPLPENAVCQDPENLQRTDAWRCINDAIEYNGYCKHDSRFLNGVIILKNESYFEGGHQIKINNQGGSSDALVKIVDENTRKGIVTFYVRQGDSFAVEDIKNGTYGIYFKYFDYNNNTLQSRGSQKMERSRVLQSSIEGNYIQYDAWDITIYPVVNGNASTDTISDQDFESI